jgi:hypothetical protein
VANELYGSSIVLGTGNQCWTLTPQPICLINLSGWITSGNLPHITDLRDHISDTAQRNHLTLIQVVPYDDAGPVRILGSSTAVDDSFSSPTRLRSRLCRRAKQECRRPHRSRGILAAQPHHHPTVPRALPIRHRSNASTAETLGDAARPWQHARSGSMAGFDSHATMSPPARRPIPPSARHRSPKQRGPQ